MNVLCLDLGTQMGWAGYRTGLPVKSGTESFAVKTGESLGMRYVRFRNWLDLALRSFGGINIVYYEKVHRHSGTQAAHVYGGLEATLATFCETFNITYQGVGVGAIKKHITGKGNANKSAVIKAVKNLGFDPKDDNEADALAIMDMFTKGKLS